MKRERSLTIGRLHVCVRTPNFGFCVWWDWKPVVSFNYFRLWG